MRKKIRRKKEQRKEKENKLISSNALQDKRRSLMSSQIVWIVLIISMRAYTISNCNQTLIVLVLKL